MPGGPTFSLRALALLVALAMCGCGGGGGDDTSTPPGQPPPGSGTLVLNEGNVDALALGLSISEGTLAIAQVAANAIITFAGESGIPEASCINSGTVAVLHDDHDASFDVSAGDELHLTFTDCYDRATDAIGNGTIDVSITSFDLDPATALVSGVLSIPQPFALQDRIDPALNVRVTALAEFEFRLETLEITSVRGTGDRFLALEAGGATERISDFEIVKTATLPPPRGPPSEIETEIELSLLYDSGLLGGSFTCVSTDLRFEFSGPAAAEVQCTGRDRSAIRLTNIDEVEIDDNGDGAFAPFGTLSWSQTIDGFLERGSGLDLAGLLGDFDLKRLMVTANDVVYDAVRDRLLVTTAATDPVSPNSLLEVSLSPNERRVAISFPSEPDLVRISDDGTLLYVTFKGTVEIRRYDAATLQQVSTIQVQSDQPFIAQREILDLAVSPLDPHVIAVAFGFLLNGGNTDVAIVDGDNQLARSFHDVFSNQSAGRAVEYSGDGARIFVGGEGSRVLDVDAAGVASATRIRNRFPGFQLQRVGDRLYSGDTALDEQTLVRLGTYNGNGNAFGIDIASNLVIRAARDTITVFDKDRFVPLASYDSGLNQEAEIRKVIPAGQFAVLVDEHALHIFDYADVDTLNAGVCEVEALVTDQGEPYTRYACPVSDAVYDPARDKIYASIDSFLGINGNSIAVIDRASGMVERYAYIGSDPRKIGISTDGSRLYAIFNGADTVAALNLSTFTLDWNLQLDLLPLASAEPELTPQRALDFAVSPVENDAIVVAISERDSGSTFIAIRNGTRLADEVQQSDFQSGPSLFDRRPFFDASGSGYALSINGDAMIDSLFLGPTGLSAGSFFDASPVLMFFGQFAIAQNEVFTDSGGVINLTDQTAVSRYPGGFAVNPDVASGDVYVLRHLAGTTVDGIARYDYLSGALIAERHLDSSLSTFLVTSLIDVGTDQLGVVMNTFSGLIVIDKAAIE